MQCPYYSPGGTITALLTEQTSFYMHSASKQKGCVSLREFPFWGQSRGVGLGRGVEGMVAKDSRIFFLYCTSTIPQLLKIFLLYFYISFLIVAENLG